MEREAGVGKNKTMKGRLPLFPSCIVASYDKVL